VQAYEDEVGVKVHLIKRAENAEVELRKLVKIKAEVCIGVTVVHSNCHVGRMLACWLYLEVLHFAQHFFVVGVMLRRMRGSALSLLWLLGPWHRSNDLSLPASLVLYMHRTKPGRMQSSWSRRGQWLPLWPSVMRSLAGPGRSWTFADRCTPVCTGY
jgi:hypothetical protein